MRHGIDAIVPHSTGDQLVALAAPDITLIALVSDAPGTRELKELSLAVNTPDGLVLVVGCSHPGSTRSLRRRRPSIPKST
jgi:7,8-dihydropterin-6-yl-methyl-4-(beta-D-ribofuranosyl)aminobenzene 5'-phosphate synthase